MALTFVPCQSCGGRTQINPLIPAAEQLCVLCGKPCGAGEEEDFELPPEEALPDDAQKVSHLPSAPVQGVCPHCFAGVVVDSRRDLKDQRCASCGQSLVKKRKVDQQLKADAPDAEDELFRRSKDRVWLPVVGVSLIVILACTWVLWMWLRPETKNAPTVEALPPAESEVMSALVAKFGAAQSPGEVLPLVREPAKFEASVTKWFASRPPGPVAKDATFVRIGSRRTAMGVNLCRAVVSGWNEPLLLAETPRGWRVEWRAFAAEGDMSVEEFLEKKPQEPVLLLTVVQRSSYYNEPFNSSEKWESLYVTGGRGRAGLHAYIPRSEASMIEKTSAMPLPPGDGRDLVRTSRRMALRLRFPGPDAAGFRLAEVVSIEGDGWFIP